MCAIRPAVVAGAFYPRNATELDTEVRNHLAAVGNVTGSVPKAIIAPHAGYIYSGPVAASVYALVAKGRGRITRVVLLGPSHRVPFAGLALSSVEAYATPLGTVPIDVATVDRLGKIPGVRVYDVAHSQEHSLEVHLPFLQVVIGDFQLVPIVVGDASAELVASVLNTVWGGIETLVVVSSDLSHYLDYESCRQLDRKTTTAIEALALEPLDHDQACGRVPIAGLLEVARQRKLQVKTVDLRNSGDTAGSYDRVVGYGAWVFEERGA